MTRRPSTSTGKSTRSFKSWDGNCSYFYPEEAERKTHQRAIQGLLFCDDECLVRIRKLRLLSLDRRFIADVVFFYKVINNHIRLTLDSRVRFSRDVDRGYALRSMDTPNLLTSLFRTNLFKFSFMKRIVGEWNSLSLDIREASSVADFKSKVS